MTQISIIYNATYTNNDNIFEYGYLICNLKINVRKINLLLNIDKYKESNKLNKYFLFLIYHKGYFYIKDSTKQEKYKISLILVHYI